ncbi:MAG: threonylcarbamoyl-AMP synthase [Saprospiraceae bacterium]|jgi:tRNA threonylcarbamoyl adenosine modification protein (Sua5/YciO/YrdC/YwlC family)|nr:threonylcarbamoyl-AMP synthase [Saprospiraceae bacterium]
MMIQVHPKNPEPGKIQKIVEVLEKGGVIIYPTDSVYALGCDLLNKSAIEKIIKLRGDKVKKFELTFICSDISMASDYIKPIDTATFRVIKRNTPGAFTFIMEANIKVGKMIEKTKKTVGIRIPGNPVALAIIQELGRPILSISLKSDEDESDSYLVDPIDIKENFDHVVDIIVDAGLGTYEPTTVVDVENEFTIIRQSEAVLDI